jgi:glutathione S-transferase
MESKITIFGAYLSPACRAVWYTTAIGGVELEHVLASVIDKPAELHELNPLGQIPVIKEGDFSLSQGNAICKYLNSTRKLGLVPDDVTGRAKMDQYLDWAITDFARAMGGVLGAEFFWKVFGNPEPAPEEKMLRWKDFNKQLDFLDRFLEGRQWLVGDEMTLADIRAYACCSQMKIMGLPLESTNWANIDPWFKTFEGNHAIADVNDKGVAFFKHLRMQVAD